MPTAINVTTRFIHSETAKVYWVGSITDVNSPTRSELEFSGVGPAGAWDLTGEIADMTGWEVSANRVPVPDLGSKLTSKIAGRVETGDAQITFYSDTTTNDIRKVLTRGDRGFIVIMDGGDVTGQTMDVHPVDIVSISKPISVEDDPAQVVVDFGISDLSGEDVVIPAQL